MLTLERLKEMIELQEKLEIRIDGKDWRKKNHNYTLCIHMECAEIMDHYGWKHWKDTAKEPDLDAIAMEIVDIWHFSMAYCMSFENFNTNILYRDMLASIEEYELNTSDPSVEELCIGFSFKMYTEGQLPLGNFIGLMNLVDMNWDDLYTLYVSKNVLNWFRQDQGYKEGRYIKNWGGKEDNEHLHDICIELGDDLNSSTLYKALRDKYEASFE